MDTPLVNDTSQYTLRNSRNINIPFTRTEISRKSCIPSFVSLWHSLEDDIRSSSSLSGFKENIKKKLRPNSFNVLSLYLQGDRWLSVQHARMRNNCSIYSIITVVQVQFIVVMIMQLKMKSISLFGYSFKLISCNPCISSPEYR